MRRRHIPSEHLVRLDVTAEERCSRQEYDEKIRKPVRRALAKIDPEKHIRCLVVMYGVPLAIRPPEPEQESRRQEQREQMDTRAAVDSELALVLTDDYPLAGWLANPYFLGLRGQETRLDRDTVLIVSRLDGPDPATVRRLVDDVFLTEKQGLQGRTCFDARWPKPAAKNLSGYALYDASLHAAAEAVRASDRMETVRLDAHAELFQPGDCPKAALY